MPEPFVPRPRGSRALGTRLNRFQKELTVQNTNILICPLTYAAGDVTDHSIILHLKAWEVNRQFFKENRIVVVVGVTNVKIDNDT